MADFKGGRGKRAPYKTVMYRIPAPIKPVVEMMGHTYRLLVDGSADPTGENLISRVKQAILYSGTHHPPVTSESLEADPDDEDPDDEEFDPDIDDDSEPTDAEVIRTQVKNLQSLMTEVRMLKRELVESEEKRSQLDNELNQLHATNGDLNLEIVKLQEKLAESESSGSQLEQMRSQLLQAKAEGDAAQEVVVQLTTDQLKAANILRPTLKFASNAGGKIKTEIRKALELIDDV